MWLLNNFNYGKIVVILTSYRWRQQISRIQISPRSDDIQNSTGDTPYGAPQEVNSDMRRDWKISGLNKIDVA
jgi:hypothetical protein